MSSEMNKIKIHCSPSKQNYQCLFLCVKRNDFIKICFCKDNMCLLFRHHRNEVDLCKNVSVIYMCAAV